MEKKIILILMAVMILISNACENGFDEINTNKTALNLVDPVLMLNGATLNASYTSGSSGGSVLIYDMGIVQQIITPVFGVVVGANFNKENRLAGATLWQNYYLNVIRNTKEAIALTEKLPERANLYNMTRILQAYAFMVLTDTYGNIPYFQGGNGYRQQVFYPVYDSQETIYLDLIKELEEASVALNPAGRIETSDVLYSGNIDKWRKFGYSLLLRAGMRLSKINPTKAASTVQTAFAGGTITANVDNAVIRHDDAYRNGHGVTLNSTEGGNFYLAEPFVNYLKNTNDPRLTAIAVRYTTATNNGQQASGNGATVLPADQVGLPIGSSELSYSKFSQVDRKRMMKLTAPCFLVTAAQSQLLLAEARHNNLIATGTEKDYYDAGVKLHMEQMASFDAASAVSSTNAENYLIANPFVPATALEQINTQYWIASFLNGPEAFANFRRSGYPVLVENPFVGQDIASEDFIRRITYPTSEISANTTNVNVALEDMGPDRLDTRVWWDKP
jgi:hypothetical protein